MKICPLQMQENCRSIIMDIFVPAGLYPSQCIARTKKGEQCKAIIPKQRLMEISYDIVAWKGASEDANGDRLLELMVRDLVCSRHSTTQYMILELLQKYRAQITYFAKHAVKLPLPHSSPCMNRNSKTEFATKLGSIIKQNQFFDGCVYVFTSQHLPGLVKIGSTKQEAADDRIKEWQDCYYKPERVFSATFKFPQRFEELIHLQLASKRCQVTCWKQKSVHKTHDEWFKCSREEIVDIIKQWKRLTDVDDLYDPVKRNITERWGSILDRLVDSGGFNARTWMSEVALEVERQNLESLSMKP